MKKARARVTLVGPWVEQEDDMSEDALKEDALATAELHGERVDWDVEIKDE